MRSRFLFATAMLLGICWGMSSQPAARAALPNIVVFLTDDQTLADHSVMAKTKALLADQGTTFSRCFATHGLCAPSRATFLTGQYPHNHNVLENNRAYEKLDHTDTLPVWLQARGYHTAYIGKYLNGLGSDVATRPPGWNNWQALLEGGTYSMYKWTINDNGTKYVAGSSEADYQTDALAVRAAALIQSRQGESEPLFLIVAPASPHKEEDATLALRETIRPPARYINAFATLPFPKPPSYNEANVRDKPGFIRSLLKINSSEERTISTRFRNRREALLAIDDLVEKVVNAVEAARMLDNTVFVFTSDNGYHFGEHRIRGNKNKVYEESLRVPLKRFK